MIRTYLFLVIAVAGCLIPCVAFAGTGEKGVSAAGLLFIVGILLAATICFLLALKVFSLLKGGELASAWQILAIAFLILLVAEAVKLVDMLNIANLGDNVSMLIRLIGIAAVMIGISRIKSVLS